MLKLEKTVCFESADWNSNIWVHRPFFCQLKIFPVIGYVRTVKNPARCFSARSKPIPSKRINSQGVDFKFPSRKQLDQTKNSQNDARQETVYNWKSLNCRIKYSKYSFLCSDKNTKTVVRIIPLFGKKVGVSKNGVSKLNNQSESLLLLKWRLFKWSIGVLTLQNLMKVSDESMALWFLSQIVINDSYNLKISFQCICMFSVSETVRSAHICVLSPPPSEVRASYRKKTRNASVEDESSCVRVRSNACTTPWGLRASH